MIGRVRLGLGIGIGAVGWAVMILGLCVMALSDWIGGFSVEQSNERWEYDD